MRGQAVGFVARRRHQQVSSVQQSAHVGMKTEKADAITEPGSSSARAPCSQLLPATRYQQLRAPVGAQTLPRLQQQVESLAPVAECADEDHRVVSIRDTEGGTRGSTLRGRRRL